MVDEKIFKHAVTLASAFVANGDIRCGGNTNKNTSAMAQINDIIPTLYSVIRDAHQMIESQENENS